MAAARADAFRCGNDLVGEGDRKYEVLTQCGEPDFRESYAEGYLEGIGPVGIVEQWYYNSGPGSLVRVLTFHQGRLRSVVTDGHGFDEDRPGVGCGPDALHVGMSKYELLARCGDPVARDEWFEHGSLIDRRRLGTVLVEEWTYAFGSNRFPRFVRIVRGRVVGIEHGEKND